MHIGFNLKYINTLTTAQESYYFARGKELFEKYSNQVEVKLDELLLDNGNLDGGKMEENWFPSVEADIFLSHSHKNEKDAIILSGYLYDKLNVKTFVDSCIWGYSDVLLKDLDNKFCKRDDGYYNYNKRNFTTSNVHMMLSTALTKMIDKTECIFFLNTPQSISFKEGVKSSTQSPWIYAEIEISKMIRRKKLFEYRRAQTKTFSDEDVNLNESFEFPLDLAHLITIDNNDIKNWINQYKNDEYSLNILYQLKSTKLI